MALVQTGNVITGDVKKCLIQINVDDDANFAKLLGYHYYDATSAVSAICSPDLSNSRKTAVTLICYVLLSANQWRSLMFSRSRVSPVLSDP